MRLHLKHPFYTTPLNDIFKNNSLSSFFGKMRYLDKLLLDVLFPKQAQDLKPPAAPYIQSWAK